MNQNELTKELETPSTSLCVVSWDKFLQLKLPPQEAVLDPWLNTQGLAMIYAPRGIGKTHVALGVAHAVAAGGEFLRWHAPKPRGVLYLDGEMPANMLQERLAAIVAANQHTISAPLQILTPDLQSTMQMPDLASLCGQTAIEPYLENIELIIVDNIATLCRRGSENETEAWKPVQDWALRMRASGRAVLFIHHAGKKGLQRGASAREDTLSTVIRLARPEQYSPTEGAVFEIHFEKTRGILGDAVKPFKAQLTHDAQGMQQWLTEDLEPDMSTLIAQRINAGYKQHEIALEFNLHKSSISRYANRAKEQGLLNKTQINGKSG